MHIFLNMLFLWMMGSELERYWGSKEFLKYYLVTGIGAGLVNAVAQPRSGIPIIGASGAIFGLIIAFALAFPEREILLYFFIRMKAKHFACLVAGIEIIALFAMPGSGIARLAHLGGLVVGFFYLKHETLSYSLRRKARAWQRRMWEAEERRKEAERARRSKEVDRILDKINTQGIESLTEKEKRFLERQGGRRF
jgi:membrane associated rhomboid family serine protease